MIEGWKTNRGSRIKVKKERKKIQKNKGKILTPSERKEEEKQQKKVKHSLFEPPPLWTLPEGREDGRLQDI